MRIKLLRPPQRPGGKLAIVFDDGSVMKVVPAVAADQGLFDGKELDDEALARLQKAASQASAKSRAVRIISAAGVSKGELERRLIQKGETPADAKTAVTWLTDLNLLDDGQAARDLVQRGIARGYGPERLRQMLYEKRIPREYWDEALSELPDQSEQLRDFLTQKMGPDPDRKARDKAVSAALRRGFTWSQIQSALYELRQEL